MNATTLSPEIQELRKSHVGASEVAALFGLHPFKTSFELWHEKSGNLESADISQNPRVKAGVFLEAGIGAWVAHETGWNVRKVTAYAQHPTIAGMGCTPDYEADGHPTREGVGTVQIKNVDSLVFRGWEDGPPMVYQLQVQHEIACGGYAWGALGILVGGNDLRIFEYDRHPGAIAKLEAAVAEFWRTVHAGEAPDPDFARDLDALRELYRETNTGEVLDLSTAAAVDDHDGADLAQRRAFDFADACRRYTTASFEAQEAEKRKSAAQAEIVSIVQNAAIAIGDGFKVSTWPVAAGEVSFTRAAYRGMRVSILSADKPKKGRSAK